MAKDKGETIEVQVAVLEQLQARLQALEHAEAVRQEKALDTTTPRVVLDDAWETWKAEAARPASERTQDLADKRYGRAAPRFRVHLDSTTEEGKPGPRIDEHFPLEVSANSDLEAQARYLKLMGIKKHDYTIHADDLAAAVA